MGQCQPRMHENKFDKKFFHVAGKTGNSYILNMNKISIRIDLSDIFDDERKKVLLMINPDWETVECLQNRVENLFELQHPVRFLSEDGCFIPPQESIEIMQFCNGIKAFISNADANPKKTKKEAARKKLTIPEVITAENDEVRVKRKKRKHQLLENAFVSSTPHKSKRSKNIAVEHNILPPPLKAANNAAETSSAVEQISPPIQIRLSSTQAVKESKKNGTSVLSLSAVLNDDNKKLTNCSETKTVTPQVEAEPKSSKTRSVKNPFANSILNSYHIFYNESEEKITPTNESVSNSVSQKDETIKEPKKLFGCVLEGLDTKKPRIFQIKRTPFKAKEVFDRSKIEIQENIVLSPVDVNALLKSQTVTDTLEEDKDDNVNDKCGQPNTNSKDQNILDESKNSGNNSNTIKEKHENVNASENALESVEAVSCKEINSKNSHENGNHESVKTIEINRESVNETNMDSVSCVDLSIDLDGVDAVCEDKSKSQSFDKRNVSGYDSSDVEEIIDLNETADEANNISRSKQNMKISNIMPYCIQMTQIPEIGNLILFRVPYTTNGLKCRTDFLAGEVEYINKRTKLMKILIIDGHYELRHVPSKFLNSLDDSMCTPKHVHMKPSDMIEPKICHKKSYV